MQDGRAKWRRVEKSAVCVKKKRQRKDKREASAKRGRERGTERKRERHRGTEERKDTRTHSFLIGGACSPHISLPSLFTLCLFLSCWCGWMDVDRAQFVGIRRNQKRRNLFVSCVWSLDRPTSPPFFHPLLPLHKPTKAECDKQIHTGMTTSSVAYYSITVLTDI